MVGERSRPPPTGPACPARGSSRASRTCPGRVRPPAAARRPTGTRTPAHRPPRRRTRSPRAAAPAPWAEGGPDEEQAVGPWESAAVQEAPDEGQETPDDGPRPLGVGLRPTGHAPVDGHLRRLEDADHLAVSAHQEVYEDVHRGLRETLAALDRPHTPRS
ncbi:hypothetical protein ACWV95_08505 [Streptomyces albus]